MENKQKNKYDDILKMKKIDKNKITLQDKKNIRISQNVKNWKQLRNKLGLRNNITEQQVYKRATTEYNKTIKNTQVIDLDDISKNTNKEKIQYVYNKYIRKGTYNVRVYSNPEKYELLKKIKPPSIKRKININRIGKKSEKRINEWEDYFIENGNEIFDNEPSLKEKAIRFNEEIDKYNKLNKKIKNMELKKFRDYTVKPENEYLSKKTNAQYTAFSQPLLKNYNTTIFDGEDKDSFEELPESYIVITKGDNLAPDNYVTQYFREGSINCVLHPIKKFIQDKIENAKSKSTRYHYQSRLGKLERLNDKYFQSGVNEEGLDDIAQTLQVDLEIAMPFQNSIITAKSNKKPLRGFKYVNTKWEHVELDQLSYDENIEVIDHNKMLRLQKKLDDDNTYYTYKKNYCSICEIRTIDTIYKLPNDYSDAVREFEDKTGIKYIKICDIKNKNISEFVRQGNHFNECVDISDFTTTKYEKHIKVRDETPHKHMDMSKAYSNFHMCNYYKGFLGKITDFRKCNKIVDIGYYRIQNIKFSNNRLKEWNDKLNIWNDYNVYPSPELEFLTDNGVEFDIIEGCWGSKIDFRFNDRLLNGELLNEVDGDDVRYYCKYVGTMSSSNGTKCLYMKTNHELTNNMKHHFGNVSTFKQGDLNEVRVTYDKKSNYHLTHVSGFILSYMRLNMMEQLLTMRTDDVYRVVVDGIYYKDDIDVEFKNCFRKKETGFKFNQGGRSYISRPYDENYTGPVSANYRVDNKIELHLGCGGSGKTFYNLSDKGFINPTYYAPSWKLVRNKQKEMNIHSDTIAKITSTDPSVINRLRMFVSVLIIDEVSMMTEKDKQQIIKNFPDCKIIFCGDIGYQLPPIDKGDEFKIDNMKIINHNKNYRVKDDKFLEILNNCRNMMKEGKRIKEYVLENCEKINKDEMDYDHKKDMIITGTHKQKDYYTNKYKHLEKYFITKSDRVYGRGEIYLEKPKTDDYILQHAYTTHSIQGETAEGMLFIDMDDIWENRMIYTMISRARKLEQIKIV